MINRFSNRKNKRKFTEALEELVCEKKCSIQKSLFIMSKNKSMKNKAVSLAAGNIYEALIQGNSFSSALKLCPFIEFDMLYVSFIGFAQRCGTLDDTLVYLKKKCIREEENLLRITEAAVYPLFVVVLCVMAGILLLVYSTSILGFGAESPDVSAKVCSTFFISFGFLLVFCIVAFFAIKKILGTNKLYEAFLAAGFLIKGGESFVNAVNDAVNILGYDTKEGLIFAQAGERLSYGESLHSAFEMSSKNNALKNELDDAFFFAENSGGENDVFEKIALWIKTQDEKRRTVCLKLLEPVFISGTGVFLLVFLMNLVLPLFTEATLVL